MKPWTNATKILAFLKLKSEETNNKHFYRGEKNNGEKQNKKGRWGGEVGLGGVAIETKMVRSVGVWGMTCPDWEQQEQRPCKVSKQEGDHGARHAVSKGSTRKSQDYGLTFTSLTSCQYLVPVTRHRHGCPPSEAHGYLMSPLILCSTLRIWHNLLWCLAKEFHCIHRFAVLTL